MNTKLMLSLLLVVIISVGYVISQVATSIAQSESYCSNKVMFIQTDMKSNPPYLDVPLIIGTGDNIVKYFPILPMDTLPGEIKRIERMIFYGEFTSGEIGNYCDIGVNGNYCLTLTQDTTNKVMSYNNSCHQRLNIEDVNEVTMDCFNTGVSGALTLWRIAYVANLKTC